MRSSPCVLSQARVGFARSCARHQAALQDDWEIAVEDCAFRRLVVGAGSGGLPVMDEVKREAEQRGVELIVLPTAEAIKLLRRHPAGANAVLHLTC